jgi:hypothetical protein
LLAGCPVIFWDNLMGVFDSPALAAFLTAEKYRDRLLGKSETPSVPSAALVLLTGNNLTLAGDLPRRILVARIDPVTERPYAREFDFDPLAVCRGARERKVAAALTLLRGWLSSGMHRFGKGNFASFEQWDHWVRQCVIWIGTELAPGEFEDPIRGVDAAQAEDPAQEALGRLAAAWRAVFGRTPATCAEALRVYERVEAYNAVQRGRVTVAKAPTPEETELAEALREFRAPRGALTANSLGMTLRFRKGRLARGLRFVQPAKKDRNDVSLWLVEGEDEVKTRSKTDQAAGSAGSAGSVHTYAREMMGEGMDRNIEAETPPAHPADPAPQDRPWKCRI